MNITRHELSINILDSLILSVVVMSTYLTPQQLNRLARLIDTPPDDLSHLKWGLKQYWMPNVHSGARLRLWYLSELADLAELALTPQERNEREKRLKEELDKRYMINHWVWESKQDWLPHVNAHGQQALSLLTPEDWQALHEREALDEQDRQELERQEQEEQELERQERERQERERQEQERQELQAVPWLEMMRETLQEMQERDRQGLQARQELLAQQERERQELQAWQELLAQQEREQQERERQELQAWQERLAQQERSSTGARETEARVAEFPICPICLDNVDPTHDDAATKTSCGHNFHKQCLCNWIDVRGTDATCPCCRHALQSR